MPQIGTATIKVTPDLSDFTSALAEVRELVGVSVTVHEEVLHFDGNGNLSEKTVRTRTTRVDDNA